MAIGPAPLRDGLQVDTTGLIQSKAWREWFSKLSEDGGVAPALHASTHQSGGSDTVNHDLLVGFVSDEHVAHTSVSISAGTGLSGGGDISASRTINLDHLGLENLVDPGADRILFWDDSASKSEWLTVGTGVQIVDTTLSTDDSQIDHDALLNYVSNEHIDWTNATNNLLTTGSGTFGTLVLGSGSITDSSGSISFGNENISTTGTVFANDYYGTGYIRGAYVTTTAHITAGTIVNAGTQYTLNSYLALWAPERTSNGVGEGTLVNMNTSIARYNFAMGSYSQGEGITNDHCSSGGPSSLQLHTAASYISVWGGDALKGYAGIPSISHVSAFGYGTGFYSEGSYCLYLGELVGSTNVIDYRFMMDITDNKAPLMDGHFWDNVTNPWLKVNGSLEITNDLTCDKLKPENYSIYVFDATNDYVNYGSSIDYDIGSNDASISFWAKFNDITTVRIPICRGAYGVNAGYYMQLNAGNIEIVQGITVVLQVSLSGTEGVLTNWVFKKIGGDKWYVYKNGVEVSYLVQTANDPASTGTAYSLLLGAYSDGSLKPDMEITDLRWFNAAITDAQIASIYEEEETPSNLYGWWKCDEVYGNVSIDSSTRNNNGTIVTNDALTFHSYGTIENVFTRMLQGGVKLIADTFKTDSGKICKTTRETATTTLEITDEIVMVDTDGGAITINLPVGVNGTHYRITNCGTSGNDVTVDGAGTETVMGSTTQTLSDGETINIFFETTENWW